MKSMDTSIFDMAWYHLVVGVLVICMVALYEVFVDKKLKKVYERWLEKFIPYGFKADGAYKLYNKSVHDLQIPFRGAILLLFAVLVVDTGLVNLIVYILYLMVLYWLVFDILVNLLWLGQKWWFIGSTAKTDDAFNDSKPLLILFWSIKIVGILGFAAIYIIRLHV